MHNNKMITSQNEFTDGGDRDCAGGSWLSQGETIGGDFEVVLLVWHFGRILLGLEDLCFCRIWKFWEDKPLSCNWDP